MPSMPTVCPIRAEEGRVEGHELNGITCPPGDGCFSACSCGWVSESYPSAGLAGAVWDAHVEEMSGQ